MPTNPRDNLRFDKENDAKTEDDGIGPLINGKPADYQKLSSKEKRQLRNKISARNFRVRRKGVYLFLLFISNAN